MSRIRESDTDLIRSGTLGLFRTRSPTDVEDGGRDGAEALMEVYESLSIGLQVTPY
jgi:hypothetical protein